MVITQAQYLPKDPFGNTTSIRATIDGNEVYVPINLENRHFIAIQKAVADGQLTIQEASE